MKLSKMRIRKKSTKPSRSLRGGLRWGAIAWFNVQVTERRYVEAERLKLIMQNQRALVAGEKRLVTAPAEFIMYRRKVDDLVVWTVSALKPINNF